jgi:hypothetical protein
MLNRILIAAVLLGLAALQRIAFETLASERKP